MQPQRIPAIDFKQNATLAITINKIQPKMSDNNPLVSAADGNTGQDKARDNDVVVVVPPPKKKARKNNYRGVLVWFINFLDNKKYKKEDVLASEGITKD